MAIQSVATLKGWFVTLARPVQSQFHDWLDSFRHRNEKITAADLEQPLIDLLNSLPPSSTIEQLLTDLTGKADLDNTGKLVQSQWPDTIGPETITYNGDGTYTIPAGRLLEKIVVMPASTITMRIGSAAGGADLQVDMSFNGAAAEVVYLDLYAIADRAIYLSGITSQTVIKFFKK